MAASTRDPLNLAGTVLAQKYEVQEAIAEGGFSIVYRAYHRIWKKPTAIKVFNALALPPGELRAALQEAFLKEGALLAELSSMSTSIVQAWDVGTYTAEDGSWFPYLVLEWLEGKPLDLALDDARAEGRGRLTLEQVMQLLEPVARALGLAHARGIAHRDLKPENLFVLGNPHSLGASLKLLDFGVAKVMDDKMVRAALAKTGGSVKTFTPEYGAPEQFSRSRGATGPWTDVYQLALVMVEMLSGARPLGGASIAELSAASTDPTHRPTPRNRGVMVSDAVEGVFLRALAVAPADRPATATAFWEGLREATGHLAQTHHFSAPPGSAAAVSSPQNSTPTRPGTSEVPHVKDAPTGSRRFLSLAVWTLGLVLGLSALSVGTLWLWAKRTTPELSSVGAAPADLGALSARYRCPAGMTRIDKGQFFMGSDLEAATPDEKPAFAVSLDAYCIDDTEVTVQAYLECSRAGRCKRPGTSVRWPNITEEQKRIYATACNADDPTRGNHPINCVDYFMAERFCEVRGARLPTEAEWEYATRGPDGRIYPWGDEDPTPQHLNACGSECVAWGKERGETLYPLYDADDGFPTTAPVGSFPKGSSRFGPKDVVGNVWEWVADWHGPYSRGEKKNPKGPQQGDRKVIRGGAFNGSQASWLRPSFRYAQEPSALSHGIGFRCAKSLD
ncbi:MAG: bifunctional serine/threonine-protein kinase/formylglycine-generating enzyme family protein [Polyangiaceae bacterium]